MIPSTAWLPRAAADPGCAPVPARRSPSSSAPVSPRRGCPRDTDRYACPGIPRCNLPRKRRFDRDSKACLATRSRRFSRPSCSRHPSRPDGRRSPRLKRHGFRWSKTNTRTDRSPRRLRPPTPRSPGRRRHRPPKEHSSLARHGRHSARRRSRRTSPPDPKRHWMHRRCERP